MRDGVAALLKRSERGNEEPTLNGSPSSQVEREVLETLRRAPGHYPSLRELRSQLLPLFTELQIQTAILTLIEKHLILLINGDRQESVLKLAPTESPTEAEST